MPSVNDAKAERGATQRQQQEEDHIVENGHVQENTKRNEEGKGEEER